MNIPRRTFLNTMLCASTAFLSSCRLTSTVRRAGYTSAPLITNYNDTGDAVLIEGKTLLVSITSPSNLEDLSGSLPMLIEPESANGAQFTEPQPLFFYPDREGSVLRTILSAPLDVIEGEQRLRLSKAAQPDLALWNFPYLVRRGNYRSSAFMLDKEFSSPNAEIAAQIKRDFETMLSVLKQSIPRRWHKPFVLPVYQGDNNNFGDKRTVNNTKRYRHAGLDLHAKMRTEVHAINDGVVALSAPLWVAGNIICINHGNSIFSKYAHLDQSFVREGQEVKRGDVIALSGNSGGQKAPPHLHLDVIINGIHVDPKDFMFRTAAQLLAVESGTAGRI